MTRVQCIGFVLAAAMLGSNAIAQELKPVVPQTPGFQSKPILSSPITGVEGKEVVLISVTLAPGASSPAHTHPGDCHVAVLEGTIELRVEGKEPRMVTGGEAYSNLAGPVHQFANIGDKPARLLNTLVVEKGKPRTVMQPAAAK